MVSVFLFIEKFPIISVGLSVMFFCSVTLYRKELLYFLKIANEFHQMIYPNFIVNQNENDSNSDLKKQENMYVDKYWDLFEKTPSTFQLSDNDYDQLEKKFVCKINKYIESDEYKSLLNNMVLYNEDEMSFVSHDEIDVKIPEKKREELISESYDEIVETKVKCFKQNLIFEDTPFGNVCMSYDSEDNGFLYYSDKCIPNEILDTVARKYVYTYKCRPLYVLKETIEKEKKEEKDQSKTEEENKKKENDDKDVIQQEKKPSVFAKLKSYNQRKTEVKQENIEKPMNRFIYKGKMTNYDLLKRQETKTEKLTFSDYKKIKNL